MDMLNGFKITKYWIVPFLMVCIFTSTVQAQQTINERIKTRVTERLRKKGLSPKEIEIEVEKQIKQNNDLQNSISNSFENEIKSEVSNSRLTCTDIPADQKAFLQQFYNNFNGAGSTWATNWDFNTPVTSWNGTTGWKGISIVNCNIVSLQVVINNTPTTYNFPDISALTKLQYLTVAFNPNAVLNQMQGNISNIGNLPELKYLQLNSVNLNGVIPTNFLNLTDTLLELRLDNCNLSDNSEFCSMISNFHSLNFLSLNQNDYSGSLPTCINPTNLPNLKYVIIGYNQFEDISVLSQFLNLEVLWAFHNSISSIPDFSLHTNLTNLYLDYNNISGTIPSYVETKGFHTLRLEYNNLEGYVPHIKFVNHYISNPMYGFSTSGIRILGNKFRFIDIADNFDYIKNTFSTFDYSPQADTDTPLVLNVLLGQTVNLKMFEDDHFLAGDTFTWYKQNTSGTAYTAVTNEITGNNIYSFIADTDSPGVYYCISKHYSPAMTNPSGAYVKNLILKRKTITVQIAECEALPTGVDGTFNSCDNINFNNNNNGNVSCAGWVTDHGTPDTWKFPIPSNAYGGINPNIPSSSDGVIFAGGRVTSNNPEEDYDSFKIQVNNLISGETYKVNFEQINFSNGILPAKMQQSDPIFPSSVRWKVKFGEDTQYSQSMPTVANPIWSNQSLIFVADSTSQTLTFQASTEMDTEYFLYLFAGVDGISVKKICAPIPECIDCTSFNLIKSTSELTSKYLVSGWVQESGTSISEEQARNFNNALIRITFKDVSGGIISTEDFHTSGEIIDGWQRIIGEFVVPSNVDDFVLELVNGDTNPNGKTAYFDDIRVLPTKGNMKSFVYDQKTQRLMAELDENNYGTFYEYDLEGGLIRIKKETEKGVFTIQETRSGNAKPSN
jgi:hypothetical protein